MQRVGFLILADEMLRRSGARSIEVRYWSDTERGEIRIERRERKDEDTRTKDTWERGRDRV